MPKSKHSEAAIVAALKQLDAGRKVGEVAREVGVSTYTIYSWKAKYGGMEVSEAQEARQSAGGECAAEKAGGEFETG